MKNKTILIAETHEEQSIFIKDAIKENNINVSVMNIETNNSEDMKNAIIDSQPDIVFTNEVKNDRPASDVIKEIQSNIKHFQPIFIISSGYSTKDIDDSLYEKIKLATEKDYDAKLSDIINVAIEEYIERDNPTYYAKPDRETVTYRNLMLRKKNIKKLNEYHQKTGISFTRLVNGAIKEFFEN